jgi:predicted small secreted protein
VAGIRKENEMNRIVLGIIMLICVVSFYGCGTMKGVGSDLKAVGGWITSGSEHVEKNI